VVTTLKSFYRKLRKQLSLFIAEQWQLRSLLIPLKKRLQVESFFQDELNKVFFILGTGRSGTQLLTSLLNKEGQSVVFHEPNFCEDVATMERCRERPEEAVSYWKDFRQFEVYKHWHSRPDARIYGEVNGTIRYHAKAITSVFPEAKLFLLSRDGRGFVRSVMGWPQFYSPESKGAYALSPLSSDPYYDEWESMSRFEKVCWGWMEANESIMQSVPESAWVQLEKVSTDYEYFSEEIARSIGLDTSYQDWYSLVSKPSQNASKSYDFPEWQDWTPEQQSSFRRICGHTMERLGYKF